MGWNRTDVVPCALSAPYPVIGGDLLGVPDSGRHPNRTVLREGWCDPSHLRSVAGPRQDEAGWQEAKSASREIRQTGVRCQEICVGPGCQEPANVRAALRRNVSSQKKRLLRVPCAHRSCSCKWRAFTRPLLECAYGSTGLVTVAPEFPRSDLVSGFLLLDQYASAPNMHAFEAIVGSTWPRQLYRRTYPRDSEPPHSDDVALHTC